MRRAAILSSIALLATLHVARECIAVQPEDEPAPSQPLTIRVVGDDWGGAPPENVEKVCRSAAMQLWPYFPGRRLHPIRIERSHDGPIVLFRRSHDGEYTVRLDAEGLHWAQFAYQFSHEFCHILCNYRDGPQPNKWFEESLCETASLFALRRMAVTWKGAPPYPNWKDFAPHLESYACERLLSARLPSGATLAQWYRPHVQELYADACRRDRNQVVAGALLPVFERDPSHWEAVAWLNAGKTFAGQSFREYLDQWEYQVPERHKAFVRELARMFNAAEYGSARPKGARE